MHWDRSYLLQYKLAGVPTKPPEETMTKPPYVIVLEKSPEELQKKVCELMEQGYLPHGDWGRPASDYGLYDQAMILATPAVAVTDNSATLKSVLADVQKQVHEVLRDTDWSKATDIHDSLLDMLDNLAGHLASL